MRPPEALSVLMVGAQEKSVWGDTVRRIVLKVQGPRRSSTIQRQTSDVTEAVLTPTRMRTTLLRASQLPATARRQHTIAPRFRLMGRRIPAAYCKEVQAL